MRAPVAASVALLLASCQQERPDAAPDTSESVNAASAPAPTPSAIATIPREQVRHSILDAGGVAIGMNRGNARRFAFGSPRAAVEEAGDAWLGATERSANAECGAGPMEFTRYGGLTLNWQDGRLVGWFARQDPALVTSDGIVPGKPLRDLEVARSVRPRPDSTLDGEFDYLAADGREIGGFASGSGRDATIESLYAGVNCFFR